MPRMRANKKHPLHKKLTKLFDAMEKLKLTIEPYGHRLIVRGKSKGISYEYDLEDTEDGVVDQLPPTFEWKLVSEDES